MHNLPIPSTDAQAQSLQLANRIQQKIVESGAWISFADFMHMALYTPGLGYYSGGATKFGQGGDFVTAPEISPLYAKTLARQVAQIMLETQGNILELGAGTGKLAADLLLELQALKALPNQYLILEVSDHLRQIQCETLQKKLPDDLFKRVVWLDALPPSPQPSPTRGEGVSGSGGFARQRSLTRGEGVKCGGIQAKIISPQPSPTMGEGAAAPQLADTSPSPLEGEGWGEGSEGFNGLILANEVLDAIPVHLIVNTVQGLHERGVSFQKKSDKEFDFIWQDKPLQKGRLHDEVSSYALPINYMTEFCPAATGLVRSLGECLQTGVILMIDYGFGAAEYYHPQRNQGTLMCHYQHYAHSNPLINIGLQDITAHVNFTPIAQAGQAHGIRLAGYVNQAQFLINCGILTILQQFSPQDSNYIKLAAAAQKLLSPAEMGELFKVIAFSKDFDEELIGFKSGDKTHTL